MEPIGNISENFQETPEEIHEKIKAFMFEKVYEEDITKDERPTI